MLGFTFITDSKLSMYREKAIKSENLAKEIEESRDTALANAEDTYLTERYAAEYKYNQRQEENGRT